MKTILILTSFLFLTYSCSGSEDEPATPQVTYTLDECACWTYGWALNRNTGQREFRLFTITGLEERYPPLPPVPTDKIYTGQIENGIESYYIVKCRKKIIWPENGEKMARKNKLN